MSSSAATPPDWEINPHLYYFEHLCQRCSRSTPGACQVTGTTCDLSRGPAVSYVIRRSDNRLMARIYPQSIDAGR